MQILILVKVMLYIFKLDKSLLSQSPMQQMTNFCDKFLDFPGILGMEFHVNCLPADDSHEISRLI